jgi:hypothetical protein
MASIEASFFVPLVVDNTQTEVITGIVRLYFNGLLDKQGGIFIIFQFFVESPQIIFKIRVVRVFFNG